MNGYDVLGIGSPIIDYIFNIDDKFLEQVPGKKGGMEPISYDMMREIIGSIDAKPFIVSGGSGSNTIKGMVHLGFKCALLGVIGSDAAAKHYMNFVQKLGIIPLFQISPLHTSQVISLVTPDGERTCRSFLGASQDIHLDKITPEFFKDVKLVHIEGYSLLQGTLPERAMQLAKEAGAKISFDLASFELVEQHKERITQLLSQFVDIAFANDYEIQALTGFTGKKGCQYLKDISDTAIVKQGDNGCWVGHSTSLIHQPALKAQVIDSTGAGDLFASGFLAAYLAGKSLKECAVLGNKIGSAAVQVLGTDLSQEQWDHFKKELGR